MDLLVPTKVTGVITQGAKDFGRVQFVGSYKVAYSNDGERWTVYQDEKQRKDKVRGPDATHGKTSVTFTKTKGDALGKGKLRGLTSARVGAFAWTRVLNYASQKPGGGGCRLRRRKKRTENQRLVQAKLQAGKKKQQIYGSRLGIFFSPPILGSACSTFLFPLNVFFIRGSNGAQAVRPASLVLHQIRPHCQPGPAEAALKILFTGPLD